MADVCPHCGADRIGHERGGEVCRLTAERNELRALLSDCPLIGQIWASDLDNNDKRAYAAWLKRREAVLNPDLHSAADSR